MRSRIRDNSILALAIISLISSYLQLIGLLLFLKPQSVHTHHEWDQARSAVQRVFRSATDIRYVTIMLNESDREEIRKSGLLPLASDSMFFMIPVVGDSAIGLAIIDDVMGKDQFITYLLCVNNDLIIQNLDILQYREPYGGEVRNKSWQTQFLGKRPGDPLRAGREIKNITGATISARAVTTGVFRLLKTLQTVRNHIPRTLTADQ